MSDTDLDSYSRRNCILAGYKEDPFGCFAPRFKRPWIEFDPATHSIRSVEWSTAAEAAVTKIKRWIRDTLQGHLLLRFQEQRLLELRIAIFREQQELEDKADLLLADFAYWSRDNNWDY